MGDGAQLVGSSYGGLGHCAQLRPSGCDAISGVAGARGIHVRLLQSSTPGMEHAEETGKIATDVLWIGG